MQTRILSARATQTFSLFLVVIGRVASCTRPADVRDAHESPISFGERVAVNSEAGLIDRLGPSQLLDAMRMDTGETVESGVRFATFSANPANTAPIHDSFAAFCAMQGGRLKRVENDVAIVTTIQLPQPGVPVERRRSPGPFSFCVSHGERPIFAYRLVDTRERGGNYTRHLITVAVPEADPSALTAYYEEQRRLAAASERRGNAQLAAAQAQADAVRLDIATEYRAASFGDLHCSHSFRGASLVRAVVENKADGKYQLRIFDAERGVFPGSLRPGMVIWGEPQAWRRCLQAD